MDYEKAYLLQPTAKAAWFMHGMAQVGRSFKAPRCCANVYML